MMSVDTRKTPNLGVFLVFIPMLLVALYQELRYQYNLVEDCIDTFHSCFIQIGRLIA